jgi:hypothetical protein
MERRDFLKYFGIGATVVPVVGGVLVPAVTAKLIEEPKADVQIAPTMPPDRILEMLQNRTVHQMQVIFSDQNGQRLTFAAETFITEYKTQPIEITSYGSQFREFVPGLYSLEWELKGVVTHAPTFSSLEPRHS